MTQEYFRMVGQWRAIVDRPISKEAKQAECISVLRDFVERIAWKRIRGSNRPLRFYADMLVLRDLVRPVFASDELGEVAIRPAYALVENWLAENMVA
jgi:hypothetical protein